MHFDHVFSYVGDNNLDGTLRRFARSGFSIGGRKVEHAAGRLTGFAHMTASYLEFMSVVDEDAFQREAGFEDRMFRECPRPFGIGIRTNDARQLHKALAARWSDLPPLVERKMAHSAAWSFCVMPRQAFPGVTLFAVEYHQRSREAFEVRMGSNSIFGLGGFTFHSKDPSRDAQHWENSLSGFATASRAAATVTVFGQKLEWASNTTLRRRHGPGLISHPLTTGGIAAVKLLCTDLEDACKGLRVAGFREVTRTLRRATFAMDQNTGFAFEITVAPGAARFVAGISSSAD